MPGGRQIAAEEAGSRRLRRLRSRDRAHAACVPGAGRGSYPASRGSLARDCWKGAALRQWEMALATAALEQPPRGGARGCRRRPRWQQRLRHALAGRAVHAERILHGLPPYRTRHDFSAESACWTMTGRGCACSTRAKGSEDIGRESARTCVLKRSSSGSRDGTCRKHSALFCATVRHVWSGRARSARGAPMQCRHISSGLSRTSLFRRPGARRLIS